MESATQTLHRLTSVERYDEARELEPPVDAPGVVHGFAPMDLNRLPWFYQRYGTAHVPRAQLGLSELGRLLYPRVRRCRRACTGTSPGSMR